MIACVFFLFLSLYLSLYRVDLNQTSFRATVSSGWVTVNVRREGISQPRQARVTCREALGQGGGAAGAALIAIPRFGWAFHVKRETSINYSEALRARARARSSAKSCGLAET